MDNYKVQVLNYKTIDNYGLKYFKINLLNIDNPEEKPIQFIISKDGARKELYEKIEECLESIKKYIPKGQHIVTISSEMLTIKGEYIQNPIKMRCELKMKK